MTGEDLRKLGRKELLELMLAQGKELDTVRQQLSEAQEQLHQRQITLDQAGSIAEAALQINGVFEAAQAAAQQYLDSIRLLSERQKEICAPREAQSKEKSERLLRETEDRCRQLELSCRRRCQEMEEAAHQKSEEYWAQTHQKLQDFYARHQELKQLLQGSNLI